MTIVFDKTRREQKIPAEIGHLKTSQAREGRFTPALSFPQEHLGRLVRGQATLPDLRDNS